MTTVTPTSSTASGSAATPANSQPIRNFVESAGKNDARKPDDYYGDRRHTEAWLLQLDLYFFETEKYTEDKKKTVFAATYMRGDAAKWIKPYLTKYLGMDHDNEDEDYLENHADAVDIFEDYDNFKALVRQMFGIANQVDIAEREIQCLYQTTSAADYTRKFREYAAQIEWNDESLMRMYKQGLKRRLREELQRTNGLTDTLDRLCEEAIRIDQEWFNLEQEFARKPRASHGRPPAMIVYKNPPRQPTSRTPRDPYGYAPMEGVQYNYMDKDRGKGKGKGPRKQGHRSPDGSRPKATGDRNCFNCGKPGHFARNCRSKNKVLRTPMIQMNVMEESGKKDEEEEWQIITTAINHLRVGKRKLNDDESPDSLPYEDPNDTDVSEIELPPRSPTPHPNAPAKEQEDKKQLPNVWEYLETNQPRDIDFASEALCDVIVPVANNQLRHKHVSPDDRTDADIAYLGRRDKSYANENPNYIPRYDLDHRNPTHLGLHWTACEYDTCTIHYRAKEYGYQPKRKLRCRWEWFDCPIEKCDEHLWMKRQQAYFPHYNDSQNAATQLLINNNCTQPAWYTCMHPACEGHSQAKTHHGFLAQPEPRKETEIQIQPVQTRKGYLDINGSSDEEFPRRKSERRRRLKDAYKAPETQVKKPFLDQGSGEKTPPQN